ncbi:PPOX class F420-dependent oxidoreductase [Micromonospora sp. NPDC000089]|uniref:PPOX class F420-dependent oxidoreductase n=1 Tax=unclassified Micromonospora TaxID=2617518 RepID=UPI0036B0F7F5
MDLPDTLIDLLRRPAICFVTTLMPDGSPQITETWVDTDSQHIVVNTVQGFQKVRNVERDPRVAVAVADPETPSRYVAVRGRVVELTEDGATEHIDQLSQKYLGRPYPWFGGREQRRVIMKIAAEKISSPG